MNNNLLANPVFWSSFAGMGLAQSLKCVIQFRITKKWSFKPFFSNGGMPSSHSATVAGLTTAIGLTEGFGSTIFVLSLALFFIVINDATNVRLETGKQAETLNQWSKVLAEMFSPAVFQEEHFKTLVGHTKLQVLWGVFVGVVTSLVVTLVFF